MIILTFKSLFNDVFRIILCQIQWLKIKIRKKPLIIILAFTMYIFYKIKINARFEF